MVREEFVDFFLDGLAHAEADDKEWNKGLRQKTHDKVIAIMHRIMEELDDGLGQELLNAADEWASFNITESNDDDETFNSFILDSNGDNSDDKSLETNINSKNSEIRSPNLTDATLRINNNPKDTSGAMPYSLGAEEIDKMSNASFDFSEDSSNTVNEDRDNNENVSTNQDVPITKVNGEDGFIIDGSDKIDKLTSAVKIENVNKDADTNSDEEMVIDDSEDDMILSDSD